MRVIQVEGLTKRFGDVVAVDNLSFALEKGTVTGFLGLLFAAYGLAFALAGSRFVVRRDVT